LGHENVPPVVPSAFAYAVSLMVYQFGMFFTGAGFTIGTAAAIAVLIGMIYLVFRKNRYIKSK
jgi:ferrous iron transport protein B